jgi:hypothetical protein
MLKNKSGKLSLIVVSKNNNVGINLTKEEKNLYNENTEEKLKKTLEARKSSHVHGLVEYCGKDYVTESYLQIQFDFH